MQYFYKQTKGNFDIIHLSYYSWCHAARKLRYVKSQEEMNLAKKDLEGTYKHKFDDNSRKLAFHARWHFAKFAFKTLFGTS